MGSWSHPKPKSIYPTVSHQNNRILNLLKKLVNKHWKRWRKEKALPKISFKIKALSQNSRRNASFTWEHGKKYRLKKKREEETWIYNAKHLIRPFLVQNKTNNSPEASKTPMKIVLLWSIKIERAEKMKTWEKKRKTRVHHKKKETHHKYRLVLFYFIFFACYLLFMVSSCRSNKPFKHKVL